MAKIVWSPRAADNVESICEHISKDSKRYAQIFAEKIFETIKSIRENPLAGRVVPEYMDDKIRERIYKNYRIIYRLKDEVIEIAAIYHGAQLVEKKEKIFNPEDS
ncbi:MAG: type II toxin-antitoxin system RelE/ParE family toxin [Spirochaetae bacterium HGW-Spirochaetae-5]|nr:MAG: type II toxin-antitoxin system RelE/ParE family toxin [Spirochaetae bacterium HGW-Spirochaetae-5]